MKAGWLIAKIIVDGDNEIVSKVHVYLRTRPLAIDPNDRPGESSVGIRSDPVNAPIVLDDLCECKLAAAQQKETQRKHGGRDKGDTKVEERDILAGGDMQIYVKDSVRSQDHRGSCPVECDKAETVVLCTESW